MDIGVIIASYRRPDCLERCLGSLAAQDHAAREIIVILRQDDHDSVRGCGRFRNLPLRVATIGKPGVAAAYNLGLDLSTTEIVAFIDDDAEAPPDWLSRLARSYTAHPEAAGIGGRDRLGGEAVPRRPRRTVGRVTWYGRLIGNHHAGVGPAREVDVLKGVNMSFRLARIAGVRFDETLRGAGAQVGVELGFCLALRRRGERLIYDPAITVDHHPAKRFDEDQRDGFSAPGYANAAYNLALLTLRHAPAWRRPIFLLYAGMAGDRGSPGLLGLVRLVTTGDEHAWQKYGLARIARREARQTLGAMARCEPATPRLSRRLPAPPPGISGDPQPPR